MKHALLADIHGNIEALEAVLRDMDNLEPDKIVVLGDTIGYGPNPRECLSTAYEIADIFLCGNHEKEAVLPEKDELCSDTREMLNWTAKQLDGLPAWGKIKNSMCSEGHDKSALRKEDGMLFVHGSPKKPIVQYIWPGHHSHFIIYNGQIDDNLASMLNQFEEGHCFCAHTHAPAVLTEYGNRKVFDIRQDWNRKYTFIGPGTVFFVPDGDTVIKGLAGKKAIINPGSVGQPRDGNPAASYAVYDGDKIHFRRVPYDFEKTQKKILAIPVSQETKEYFSGRLAKGE